VKNLVDDKIIEEKRRRMQSTVSRTLKYGVILASAIVMIGVILMIAQGETGYQCDFSSINCLLSYNPSTIPHGEYPNSLLALASGISSAKPFAIIELGIVVLLATPAARVAASIFVFAAEKDRTFVVITLAVLGILLFSFFAVPYIPLFHA
jgi:uncharacterized membrane protein